MSSFCRNWRSNWTRHGHRWLILPLLVQMVLAIGATDVVMAADADHLIISEIVTRTRVIGGNRIGSEYIEIVNHTNAAIDLSEVYLSDGTFATSGTYYWNIADGVPNSATAGGGTFNDFHVRFPDGYMFAAGDTLSISVSGSDEYMEAYGQLPDFELFEDANAPDLVPEMVNVFPQSVHRGSPLGEVSGSLLPSLSDNSESLILYSWDGSTDLVTDLDYAFWGTSTAVLFDKTGVTVGAGTYLDDTDIGSQEAISTAVQNFGQSYARLSADEGTETVSGGNGLAGHDETSENMGTTWEIATVQSPPQAPATHFLTAPILLSGGNSPLAPYDGQDVTLMVEVVSNSPLTGVTFSYTVDGGAINTVAGSDQGNGEWTTSLEAQPLDSIVEWYAIVTNEDGRTAEWPELAPRFPSETWTVTEAPDVDLPVKLLISEVATTGTSQEFVEITNPTLSDVDLSNYYLTDAIYTPGTSFYWRVTEGSPQQSTVGGGAFTDFHSRFPDGFILAAGDTIVVSLAGTQAFSSEFGFVPDLELWEDDAFPDNVPDMRWIFGDEVNNSIISRTGAFPSTPTLTNAGEVVILYHWDGVSNFVTDVDIFEWYDPAESPSTSFFFTKTGQTVSGHSYLNDTPVPTSFPPAAGQQLPFPVQADFGFSYHRIDASEGSQQNTGSNGVDGRDETSEDFPTTFEMNTYDPSRPGGGTTGSGGVLLIVEAKTFLPKLGETFPLRFVSKPRSETKLRLFDQKGRLVITLFDSRFNGPPSTIPDAPTVVVWDGRDEFFQNVRAGMYIAHLSVVNSATGEEEIKIAPVVVATRLSK